MLHQNLWSLALGLLVPAALMLRALGRLEDKPQTVPVEIDRSSEGGTWPR